MLFIRPLEGFMLDAESLHVVLCNPGVRLPRVVGAYNVLVFLDIRSHQDGTLQNSVVCFIERTPVRT